MQYKARQQGVEGCKWRNRVPRELRQNTNTFVYIER